MSNLPHSPAAVKPPLSPSDQADLMGRQGYKLRFVAEGEAIILRLDPHATPYLVSLTGHTWDLGCTCLAGRVLGRCPHVAVVSAFRPCDEPGCLDGIMEDRTYDTIGGPVHVYECLRCGRTTDPRIVQEKRDAQRKTRHVA